MKPKILSLNAIYEPEKQDALHRPINKSAPLYNEWLKSEEKKSGIDFNQWTQPGAQLKKTNEQNDGYTTPPTANRGGIYYVEENELEEYSINPDNIVNIHNIGYSNYKVNNQTSALVIPAKNGNLFCITLEPGYTHHSSLSRGEDVFFAAETVISEGKFRWISNKSGHYTPDLYSFTYGIYYMLKQGFNLDKTTLRIDNYGNKPFTVEREYNSAVKFVKLYVDNGFMDATYSGEFNSLEDATNHFNKHKFDTPICKYFIKECDELYDFSESDNGIEITSFHSKYNSENENDNDIHSQTLYSSYRSAKRGRFQPI